MQIGDRFHPSRPEMFLVADRAGAVFHHVRFVQRVLLVALLALAIDRGEIDSVLEAVADHVLDLRQRDSVAERGVFVVALCAVLRERRVPARNHTRAEKFFVSALLKKELRAAERVPA